MYKLVPNSQTQVCKTVYFFIPDNISYDQFIYSLFEYSETLSRPQIANIENSLLNALYGKMFKCVDGLNN